jgi:hypothetical protein
MSGSTLYERAPANALHLPIRRARARMPDAHASALTGLAPGRLPGFADARHGGPFATHARASNALGPLTPSLQSNPSRQSNAFARVCQALKVGSLSLEETVGNAADAATDAPGSAAPGLEIQSAACCPHHAGRQAVLSRAFGMACHRRLAPSQRRHLLLIRPEHDIRTLFAPSVGPVREAHDA